MVSLLEYIKLIEEPVKEKHPKCKGYKTYFGDYGCGYDTKITCDECKYCVGKKDPEAKCNQLI